MLMSDYLQLFQRIPQRRLRLESAVRNENILLLLRSGIISLRFLTAFSDFLPLKSNRTNYDALAFNLGAITRRFQIKRAPR